MVDTILCGAYHEAGHAVFAYYHKGGVNHEGVQIGGVGLGKSDYTGMWFHSHDYTPTAEIQVSLAGHLAERKFAGMPVAYDFLEDTIDEILLWGNDDDEPEGDAKGAFDVLIREHPEASKGELITMFREHEKKVVALLDDPLLWRSIKGVAEALFKKGLLTHAEVEKVLGDEIKDRLNTARKLNTPRRD